MPVGFLSVHNLGKQNSQFLTVGSFGFYTFILFKTLYHTEIQVNVRQHVTLNLFFKYLCNKRNLKT